MKKVVVLLSAVFVLAFASGSAMAFDTEFIGGGVTWWNNLAEGNALFGEAVCWKDDVEYQPGLGAYGSLESGESKLTPYTWDGSVIGPEVGLTHTWAKPPDGLLEQWQLKFRLVAESLSGRNKAISSKSSGYRMTQDDLKLGLYGERLSQLSKRWQRIFIAEAWKMVSASKKSTIVGEKPENRDQAAAGIFGQYKFSESWSARAGASLFWQGWDRMSGVRLQGEGRFREHFMAGPFVSIPFAVPEVDKQFNAEIGDLVTIGISGRFEF